MEKQEEGTKQRAGKYRTWDGEMATLNNDEDPGFFEVHNKTTLMELMARKNKILQFHEE